MNRLPFLTLRALMPLLFREVPGEGGGGAAVSDPPADAGAGDPAAATPPTGAGDPPAPAWWEGSEYTAEERQWLAARGLTVENPAEIIPKLVKGHRSAEQRLGKGLDSIIEKPGKDQDVTEWLRANAAALGLPEKEDGYAVEPPEFWPKDAPWDKDMEAEARKIAFENGIPPKAHKAMVELYAKKVKSLEEAASGQLAQAEAAMLADLGREYGDQTGAVITRAKQAFQAVAEEVGLDAQSLERVAAVLGEKTGDAQVIRMFAKIGELMGEDSAVQIGRGSGSLTMTPADARAELARFEGPEGDYGKAFAAGDMAKLKELGARREQLAKLAARRG